MYTKIHNVDNKSPSSKPKLFSNCILSTLYFYPTPNNLYYFITVTITVAASLPTLLHT